MKLLLSLQQFQRIKGANCRAILTVAIGLDPSYRYGIDSIENYARRIDVDLFVVDHHVIRPNDKARLKPSEHAWLQKLLIRDLLNEYEAVLLIDSDVLVTPNAPDVFREFPDQAVYGVDEGDSLRWEALKKSAEIIGRGVIGRKEHYFNLGFLLFVGTRDFSQVLDIDECSRLIDIGVSFPEQTYVNLLLNFSDIQLRGISPRFNYMGSGGNTNFGRFKAYFIHYAGYSFRSKNMARVDVMRSDYEKLYQSDQSAFVSLFRKLRDLAQGFAWSVSKEWHRLLLRYSAGPLEHFDD